MTTVTVLQGLPASGKSSYARSLDALRFSLDDYRSMMGIGRESWSREKEDVAVAAMVESARAAIIAGHDISIDNTHLVPRLPRMYRKEFGQLGVEFKVCSFMNVSADECIARDNGRDESDRVGEDVIRKLAATYDGARKNGWRLTDAWMNVSPYVAPVPYGPRPDLPPVFLCDIDGTVAINDGHRGHYDYDKVANDQPNPGVISLVQSLGDSLDVIFMSGREDRCRADTEDWLVWHLGLLAVPTLHMRTTGDHRPDYLVKSELFDEHIRDRFDVKFVLDDRDAVVARWRAMGLTCCQVAPGNF